MAQRLGVRDSDVIRYAIKSMLSHMSPLCDDAIRGRSLVPVLVESGDDLIRYFEFDAYRLETIINEGADSDARVDRDDIALLAMSGLREQYLVMRMKEGNGAPHESAVRRRSLRDYLYDKYVYRIEEVRHAANGVGAATSDPEARLGTRAVASTPVFQTLSREVT